MNSDIENLIAAEHRLQTAQLNSDVESLSELLDEELIFTGPDGNIYTKADDLGAHGSGQQVMTRVEEEDLKVIVRGNAGVTWFLGKIEAVVGGQPIAVTARYTRMWTRTDESGWRVLTAHASFLPGTE
ncbi:nuclear transport factor 2 family protein [Nocardia alni]|uniref:nuclear transport factor 2 family protein n=1 Tax=Nocardia alni TaxID=2815723 RepID=UPI001C21EF64|nr:nuclear transport factor 2 family protein [Nocardia alni]